MLIIKIFGMYWASFQSIISHLEETQNPLLQNIWEIKDGYDKIINSLFIKINVQENQYQVLKEESAIKEAERETALKEVEKETRIKTMNTFTPIRTRKAISTKRLKTTPNKSKSPKRKTKLNSFQNNHSSISSTKSLIKSRISKSQFWNRSHHSSTFKFESGKPKLLPLNLLKILIDEICESKFKYDEKCIEIKQTLETMEQYLYTYLIQKYGLKSLVIDWMATIVNSINIYSHDGQDPDIILFGKILK